MTCEGDQCPHQVASCGTPHTYEERDWLSFDRGDHAIVYVLERCTTCGRHGKLRTERRDTPPIMITQGGTNSRLSSCCTGSTVVDRLCCTVKPIVPA
jgi:hypothetical protein